jgi:hypothetical protein
MIKKEKLVAVPRWWPDAKTDRPTDDFDFLKAVSIWSLIIEVESVIVRQSFRSSQSDLLEVSIRVVVCHIRSHQDNKQNP